MNEPHLNCFRAQFFLGSFILGSICPGPNCPWLNCLWAQLFWVQFSLGSNNFRGALVLGPTVSPGVKVEVMFQQLIYTSERGTQAPFLKFLKLGRKHN